VNRWNLVRKRSLHEWLLLGEAGLFLLAAGALLKCVPTVRIIRWIQRPLRKRPLRKRSIAAPVSMEQLRWAVTSFSRNAPIRLVCFPQALALHAMLRRRKISSEVLYGAARLADGKRTAHAWLRCQDYIWVGGEVAGGYTVLDIWKPLEKPD